MTALLPGWVDGITADLGIIAAAIVAVGVIWRGVIRPVLRYARRVEATIQAVDQQFRPNGGSSLRDAIDRIDTRTVALEAWRATVDARLAPPPAPTPWPRKKAAQ